MQSPLAASAAGLSHPGGKGVPGCVVLGPSGPGARGWCLLEHPGVAGGTAVPAVPTILLSPLSLPPLLSLLSPPSSHSAGLAASPFRAQKSIRVDRDGAMSPQRPPASSCSYPISPLSPGASLWDGGTKVPRQPGPVPSPAPSAPSGAARGSQCRLGSGSGPSARSPWLIVLSPPAPLSPHRHLCLGTLLGHPCRPPARPRPLNELKK